MKIVSTLYPLKTDFSFGPNLNLLDEMGRSSRFKNIFDRILLYSLLMILSNAYSYLAYTA